MIFSRILFLSLLSLSCIVYNSKAMVKSPAADFVIRWQSACDARNKVIAQISDAAKKSVEQDKLKIYEAAFLIANQVHGAFNGKVQLDADLLDLDKKNTEVYAPLQALNLATLIADNSALRKNLDTVNAFATSVELTNKTVTKEMLAQVQTLLDDTKKILPIKTVLDLPANIEKLYAQRVKLIATSYASLAPIQVTATTKIADDMITKATTVLNTPENATLDVRNNANALLATVQKSRDGLKKALSKVLAVKTATDQTALKSFISTTTTKIQAELAYAQGIMQAAAQYKILAPTQVAAIETIVKVVNTSLDKIKIAQTSDDANTALNQATSQRKPLQDALDGAKNAAAKASAAIADALTKVQAENTFAQTTLKNIAQYKTVASAQVAAVEQEAKAINDNVAKAQAAQTPEIATTVLNDSLARRKSLQAAVDKVLIADITAKAQAENTYAKDMVKYAAQFKPLAAAQVSVVEKIAKNIEDILLSIQASQTSAIATTALNNAIAQRKPLQDAVAVAKSTSDKAAIAQAATKAKAEGTFAVGIVKATGPYKAFAPTQVAEVERLEKIVATNVVKVQNAQTPESATTILNETVAQRKPLQDAFAAVKSAADKAVIADCLAKVLFENTQAQEILVSSAQYKALAPTQVAAVEQRVKNIADDVFKIQNTQNPDTAIAALNNAIAQKKLLLDDLALAKNASNKALIANALAKVQAENVFAQGVLKQALAYKTFAAAEVAKIEQLVKATAANLSAVQTAQAPEIATTAMNEAVARHQQLEQGLIAAKNISDKGAIADALTKVQAVQSGAQQIMSNVGQYQAAVNEVATVQKLAGVIAQAVTKVQEAQTPESAIAALNEAVKQQKPLQDAFEAAKKMAEKNIIQRLVVEAEGELALAKSAYDRAYVSNALVPNEVTSVKTAYDATGSALSSLKSSQTAVEAQAKKQIVVTKRQETEQLEALVQPAVDKVTLQKVMNDAQGEFNLAKAAIDRANTFIKIMPTEVATVQNEFNAASNALDAVKTAQTLAEAQAKKGILVTKRQATEKAEEAATLAKLVKESDAELNMARSSLERSNAYKAMASNEVNAMQSIFDEINKTFEAIKVAQKVADAQVKKDFILKKRQDIEAAEARAKATSDQAMASEKTIIVQQISAADTELNLAKASLDRANAYNAKAPTQVAAVKAAYDATAQAVQDVKATQTSVDAKAKQSIVVQKRQATEAAEVIAKEAAK